MQKATLWKSILGATLLLFAVLALSQSSSLHTRQVSALFLPDKSLHASLIQQGRKEVDGGNAIGRSVNGLLAQHRNESPQNQIAYSLALMQKSHDAVAGVNSLVEVARKCGYTKELCAHILRHTMSTDILGKHPEVQKMKRIVAAQGTLVSNFSISEGVYKAIPKGVELDPDNAFFPLMSAILILSSNEYRYVAESEAESNRLAAYVALERAAKCSYYEDYMWQEAALVQNLYERTFGKQNAFQIFSDYASVPAPQYGQIRNLARIFTYHAIVYAKPQHTFETIDIRIQGKQIQSTLQVKERAIPADITKSIALRRALFRVGRLMENATSNLASYTGTSLIEIALSSTSQPLDTKEQIRASNAETLRFLEQHNEKGLAKWVKESHCVAGANRKIAKETSDMRLGVPDNDFSTLFYAWTADMVLWASVFRILLLVLLALYFKHNSAENKLTLSAVFGVLIVAILCWQPQNAFLINLRQLVSDTLNLHSENRFLEHIWSSEDLAFKAALFFVEWAIPLSILLLTGLLCLKRKREFVPTFAQVSLYTATVLLLCIAFSPTTHLERSMPQTFVKYTAHNGRFLAEKADKSWKTIPPVP